MRKILFLLGASAFLCAMALAQDDSPSLGDLARQVRAQKQQKDSQPRHAKATPQEVVKDDSTASTASKDASQPKTAHVAGNDELPEQATSSTASKHHSDSAESDAQPAADRDAQAEQWKTQIQEQKSSIASLQQEISNLSSSIQFAGANCVSNCEQWNERQQQKQQQVESMKTQLEEAKHHLEDMQDTARKQGFGSAVYDP